MKFITDNHNSGDNFFFSSDDNLMSLLRCPLPMVPPLSFETPFEDPSLEPLPIRCNGPVVTLREPQIGLPIDNRPDLYQDLLDTLQPVIELVGSKRACQEIFASQDDCVPSFFKRQRTSPVFPQDSLSEDMTTLRFRPSQEKQWRSQLQRLLQYKLKHGHCCVPHSYPEDHMLARWVKRQRYQYKKLKDGDATSTMTERRIQELESIGFVWHSHAAAWFEKLNELKAFKQRNGHCNVPSHYPENAALSTWVKCQRRQYKLFVVGKSSGMTMERFQELEALGFVFDGRRQQVLERASSC